MHQSGTVFVDGAGVAIEALLSAERPRSAGVVLLHGWGGTAATMATPAGHLADEGYATVAISMRGWGQSGGVDDCGLRQPDDVVAIVEWFRTHVLIQPARVGLLGISQGGQVALLAAIRGARVDAVAAWAPVTDVAAWRSTTAHPRIPDYIDEHCADGELEARSPLVHAARLVDVPVLLVHGGADTRVPVDQSRRLHAAINANAGRAALQILEGVGHHGGPRGNDAALDATQAFFASTLCP